MKNDDILRLLGRKNEFYESDILENILYLRDRIQASRVLVIGGAGSIGRAVCEQLFIHQTKELVIVDLSENNLVEIVRHLRSKYDNRQTNLLTYALDCGSDLFDRVFQEHEGFDFVFNLSAMKHVRSEKDPLTLMRLIEVNILNCIKIRDLCAEYNVQNLFTVSTDKASNPVNAMGASKRIMEYYLTSDDSKQHVTMARFANVAFSDGSLLRGFENRFALRQPITAPKKIRRFFITPEEAGRLCLLSGFLGKRFDTFIPKQNDHLVLTSFTSIARNFLKVMGYDVRECSSEQMAITFSKEINKSDAWPCYFFESDTTGEKPFEEFFEKTDTIDNASFSEISVIKNKPYKHLQKLNDFHDNILGMRREGHWSKDQIISEIYKVVPGFNHEELNKNLDQRM
jgi:FlaA1/EpsC-like NDP-sugar epimerase